MTLDVVQREVRNWVVSSLTDRIAASKATPSAANPIRLAFITYRHQSFPNILRKFITPGDQLTNLRPVCTALDIQCTGFCTAFEKQVVSPVFLRVVRVPTGGLTKRC